MLSGYNFASSAGSICKFSSCSRLPTRIIDSDRHPGQCLITKVDTTDAYEWVGVGLCGFEMGMSCVYIHTVAERRTAVREYRPVGLSGGHRDPICAEEVGCGISQASANVLFPDNPYVIAIGDVNGAGGALVVQVDSVPIGNGAFDQPTIIPALPYVNVEDTRGAAPIPEYVESCLYPSGPTVWYEYTSTGADLDLPDVWIDTSDVVGTDYPTMIGIYDMEGRLLACGESRFDFTQILRDYGPDFTYKIAVSGFDETSGSLHFVFYSPSVHFLLNDDFGGAVVIESLPYQTIMTISARRWRRMILDPPKLRRRRDHEHGLVQVSLDQP
jgi:hypothetical protein